jgi:uncharacterized alpha-E superfamily protein
MLSRIADSLYWMMRYTERTGSMLRVLRINSITSLDRTADESTWETTLQAYTQLKPDEMAKMGKNGDEALRYMICSRDNVNSLRSIVGRSRENARGMQDHITKEVWESLNALYHKVNSLDIERALDRGEQIVMLSDLVDQTLLFNGVTDVTMPRGQGWYYMNLGKFIERGIQTIDMLDMRFGAVAYDLNNDKDIPYWRNLLLSLSGYEMYLKRYRVGFKSRNVADMAIMNTEFPRSVLYCIHRIDQIVNSLRNENMDGTPHLQKQVGRLRAKVEYAEMNTLNGPELGQFLQEVRQEFYKLSDVLGKTYFAYQ